MVEWLADRWSVKNTLPTTDVDLLAFVTHGATATRLTGGAYATAMRTKMLLRRYEYKPLVAYCVFDLPGHPEFEERIKRELFPEGIFAGKVKSTIDECLAIRAALPPGFVPRNIILITDKAHSRRARIIWRTFFPNSNIYIESIPLSITIDPDGPMGTYNNPWKVLALQALPTPAYWYWSLKGPEYLATKAKFHQPLKA